MARIRQLKPAFFTDDKVALLSRDARLFFLGVLCEADDEGRLVDSSKRLAGTVFPFDDDVTPKKVERWIDQLEEQRMVIRYTHEGGRFLYVRKFKEHQKMSHPTPSTLPPPTSIPPESLRKDTGGPPEGFVPEGVLVFEGVEVEVFEGVEKTADKPPTSERRTRAPAEFPVDDLLRAWANTTTPTLADLDAETQRFLDYHRAKGSLMADWRAAWRNWMTRAVEYQAKFTNGARPNAIDEFFAEADRRGAQ